MQPDMRLIDGDLQFFADHPDRRAHIRDARPHEMNGEFWSLGPHDSSRRRILVWRVPDYHPLKHKHPVLRIPFLAFADETIADDDAVLLPLIDRLMREAAQNQT